MASTTKAPLHMGRYRWAVASRAIAAIGGGYVLAATSAGALGLLAYRSGWLPRADATTAATMFSFVLFAVAALWAFGCSSARRAWLGIALPSAVFACVIWMLYGGAA